MSNINPPQLAMDQVEDSSTDSAPVSTALCNKPALKPKHPFRVYGYKVSHDWVLKFGKDHGLDQPDMSNDSLESAVFMFLICHLPGLQHHFVDDPSEPEYGWCHVLGIANNWNPKKRERAPSRLPAWKAVLGIGEEPRWHIPSHETIPPIPRNYHSK